MYDLRKRIVMLGYIYHLDKNLMWGFIENKLKIIEKETNNDKKINISSDIYYANYKICTDAIIEKIIRALKYNKDSNIIFSFNLEDHCPITNYSYLVIFFGPLDQIDFYHRNVKYVHISQIIKMKLGQKINMSLDINYDEYYDKIKVDIILHK